MEINEGKPKSRKVGLAFSGGAARGLAHIGVLAVLEREGIPIDMIAGTSIGAVIGALYAQGKDVSHIKKLALDLSTKKFTFWADPALPKTGLLKGRKIEAALRSIIGNAGFGDLKIPFACVATDIWSGEEVVIEHGPVWEGIRASSSLPVLFSTAKWEGRHLVDGGLVNPIPVSVLKNMGADFIIAVNVIPNISDSSRTRWMGGRNLEEAKEPNIINIIVQSIYIGSYSRVKASLEGADVVIQPEVAHIPSTDIRQVEECILLGEQAAQDSIPEIKNYLTR
ncbi:patatin-like phospholipase family protein [Chloroflexota bacterium]